MTMSFTLLYSDKYTKARAGELKTAHGIRQTPIFMPVGTAGTVKAVHQRELDNDIKAQIILGNTYHLYLRPGIDILYKSGGLHKFIHWNKPILTDSGGFQVYSLAHRRKITEEGVKFSSHIDGSWHYFTPERAIEIQQFIGGDIIMAFDECTPFPCDYSYAKKSMHLTHNWLDRCLQYHNNNAQKYDYPQMLFPIVQGSVYKDLRIESAQYIADKNAQGNAIGGLSVGEPAAQMYEMTDLVTQYLPKDKPRYLMGVGTPENILECIALGIDMFDCVMPTRNARNGQLFTSKGVINIKNKKWAEDFSALDEDNHTYVDTYYSKAYVRHLFHINERLAAQIASIHNLGFYLWLVQQARKNILEGTFSIWKEKMVQQVSQRL